MDGMGRRGLLLSLVDRAGPVNGVSGVTKAEFVNRWEVRARHESVCLRFMRIVTIPAAGQPGSGRSCKAMQGGCIPSQIALLLVIPGIAHPVDWERFLYR